MASNLAADGPTKVATTTPIPSIMKRGFLNTKKAQKEGLYPNNSNASSGASASGGEMATRVSAASSSAISMATNSWRPGDSLKVNATKLPYVKMENTALPTRYTPRELLILEYDENKKTDYPNDSFFVTTVPSRSIGGPPDPDGHSEWLVHGSTKKKILNTPGYPQPVPKPPRNVKSHVVKSTPTMGKGVFATRNIPMGEIIFAERPLLVFPRALIPATHMDLSAFTREDYTKIVMFEREQQLEAAVGRMDPDTKARLMALMNSHLEDGSGPINGIARTNGYAVDNFWDGDVRPDENNPAHHYYYYSVVCDVGSRINHSCLPNVTHAFKLSAFAMVFMASRDIKAGEQLFYSYCSNEQSASNRKAELAPYGIAQCICSSCVNATPETDTIRETYSARLAEYKLQSLTWERLGKVPPGTIDELLRYQRAVVKEGFDTEADYWAYFFPVLIKAYQRSGKTHESMRLLQTLKKRRDFLVAKEAIEKSG